MTANWHGTPGGWTNHGCRCARCTKANRDYMRGYVRARRARLRTQAIPDDAHGKASTYRDYGCRCDACREADRRARP